LLNRSAAQAVNCVVSGLIFWTLAGCSGSVEATKGNDQLATNDAVVESLCDMGGLSNHTTILTKDRTSHQILEESANPTKSTTKSISDLRLKEFRRIQLSRLPSLTSFIGNERDVSVLL